MHSACGWSALGGGTGVSRLQSTLHAAKRRRELSSVTGLSLVCVARAGCAFDALLPWVGEQCMTCVLQAVLRMLARVLPACTQVEMRCRK